MVQAPVPVTLYYCMSLLGMCEVGGNSDEEL